MKSVGSRVPWLSVGAAFALAFGATVGAGAQDAPPVDAPSQPQQQVEAEKSAARDAAKTVEVVGPAQIKLRDQGALDLAQGQTFLPQPEAGRLMRAYGNVDSDSLIGLITPDGADANWWATIAFLPAGYVRDGDAKNWNADELLSSLKEETQAANEERIKRGFPAMEIAGWIEPPAYDAATHRLVWSVLGRGVAESESDESVNYNTYALGREGYFSLDLVTSRSAIDGDKAAARQLLSRISFASGKGYEDFNASSDHIAEYGIAALVGGVALKKVGLLALGAAFALKFAKILALAAVAVAAGVRRIFLRSRAGAPRK
jgi:uncharacterized membrane-anchored protein